MSTLSRSESKDGEGAGHDAEAWVQLRGLGLRVLPLGLHIENRSRAPGVWVCGVSAVVLGPFLGGAPSFQMRSREKQRVWLIGGVFLHGKMGGSPKRYHGGCDLQWLFKHISTRSVGLFLVIFERNKDESQTLKFEHRVFYPGLKLRTRGLCSLSCLCADGTCSRGSSSPPMAPRASWALAVSQGMDLPGLRQLFKEKQ